MTELGYSLSSEEHGPKDLVRYARRAEEAGFTFALISDHYHPWVSRQGQSPFVWTVLGAIAEATEQLKVGTGVTCPILRIHPAVVGQAAATTAAAMPGRFFLGLGTGEKLNEHVLGQHWPLPAARLEMLEEAIQVIRGLWKGDSFSHRGRYYVVEEARIYTLPEEPPPIAVAASGRKAIELAGRAGDAIIGLAPESDFVERFDESGGRGKPRYGQVTVCYADTDEKAREIALDWWPNAALSGTLMSDLATPELYEAACELAGEEDVDGPILCSADPTRHVEKLREYVDAGFDHVYVHQVGPEQDKFFEVYEREIVPELARR